MKPKQKRKKKTWPIEVEHGADCYVVVAVCNFDDVLMGCFQPTKKGLADAKLFALSVALNPRLRLEIPHQANDTGFLFVRVYRVTRGTRITTVHEFDPGGKPRRKVAANG